MTRICPNCGEQIADTKKYCTACGARIQQQPPQYERPRPEQQPPQYGRPQSERRPPQSELPQPKPYRQPPPPRDIPPQPELLYMHEQQYDQAIRESRESRESRIPQVKERRSPLFSIILLSLVLTAIAVVVIVLLVNRDTGDQGQTDIGMGNDGNAALEIQQQTPESPPPAPETPTTDPVPPVDSILASFDALMSGDTLYLNARLQSGYREDEDGTLTGYSIDSVCEIAKKDGMVAVVFLDFGMHVITKDNKSYTVIRDVETVMVTDAIGGNEFAGIVPDTRGLEFVGTGSDTLNDRTLPYEAYSSNPGTETRFYSDGTSLAGIQVISEGRLSMTMTINELSKNVPPGIFDIPDSYQIVEG